MGINVCDSSFCQQFSANFFATLLGVLFGIPAGYYLNKLIGKSTEREKKKKILILLQRELNFNQAILYDWYFAPGEIPPDDKANSELSLFLRDVVWRAFADGGELQWIKEPELLEHLSIAYFQIGIIKKLSERFFEISSKPGQHDRPHFIRDILDEIHKGANEFLELAKILDADFKKHLK